MGETGIECTVSGRRLVPVARESESPLHVAGLMLFDKHIHFGMVATWRLGKLGQPGQYIYRAFVNLEQAVLDPLASDRAERQGESQ